MIAVAHKYIKQSIMLIAAMFLLTLLYVQVAGTREMVLPLVVIVVFQLVSCILYGLVWKKIAADHPNSLPTLYMSASSMRLLLGSVLVLVYCLLAEDKAEIRFFVIAFLIYYFVMLIYDTTYFVKVEKKSKKI